MRVRKRKKAIHGSRSEEASCHKRQPAAGCRARPRCHLHTSCMWPKTIFSSPRVAQASQKVGHTYSRASFPSIPGADGADSWTHTKYPHFFLSVKFVGKAERRKTQVTKRGYADSTLRFPVTGDIAFAHFRKHNWAQFSLETEVTLDNPYNIDNFSLSLKRNGLIEKDHQLHILAHLQNLNSFRSPVLAKSICFELLS